MQRFEEGGEEERTQLHVRERVGVACRKLEHPDSACVAEIQPRSSGDRRSLRCPKCMDEWVGKEKIRREGSHGSWLRKTYGSFVRGEKSGGGWEHEAFSFLHSKLHSLYFVETSDWRTVSLLWTTFCSHNYLFCHHLTCSTLTNNGHRSVAHWPLSPLSSPLFCRSALRPQNFYSTYTSYSPWAEVHTLTCLPGFCICVDPERIALSGYCPHCSTVLHMPNPLPLGHYRGIRGQWGLLF